MEPADVVLRFLESLGRRSEADFYLKLFRAEPKEQFACISVDANVARYATEAVVLDLRFLAALGLFPTVVLGLLHATDAAEHGARIRRRLERAGVPTALLSAGDPEMLATSATAAAREGKIGIVPFGHTEGATAGDRFARLGALLAALRTRKLIFLHRPGGLRQKGTLLPIVNLTSEYAALSASRELSPKEHTLVAQSRRLVFELVPHRLIVAITSPLNVFRELFTVKGAGTLLRRGAVIERHAGFDAVDVTRLRALLESSFGRPPRDGFFAQPASAIYLEESYRGAVILAQTALGPYLSKFAVDREAQGEGLGRDLWSIVSAEHPTLFWRSRQANPISEWYGKLCDGMMRFPGWHVYWKGLSPDRVPSAIEYALAQPEDMPLADVSG